MSAFTIDVMGLYYSLSHPLLLEVVNEGIEAYGDMWYQNECKTSVDRFLDLSVLHLCSIVVQFSGKSFLQIEGMCIGSCLAPVLSDLLLARYDRDIERNLPTAHAKKVFRYIDDYSSSLK
ncbi:hypothetical protein HPB49_022286 [Dermacentor silvarum]|uniref:Uncharacterized protein n=1 Tax=Dermacentor silvarum TaxID=543639 RepID=A0ACB8DGS9_DERSI|nr:hypothetical protein HPB49_022286 [Dermacentor silvarum]